MPEKKQQTQNTRPHKNKPPYKSERQSWTVPNIPPVARPLPTTTPSQDKPKPESPKTDAKPDLPKPEADKPKE